MSLFEALFIFLCLSPYYINPLNQRGTPFAHHSGRRSGLYCLIFINSMANPEPSRPPTRIPFCKKDESSVEQHRLKRMTKLRRRCSQTERTGPSGSGPGEGKCIPGRTRIQSLLGTSFCIIQLHNQRQPHQQPTETGYRRLV